MAAYAAAEQAVSSQLRDPDSAQFDPFDLRFHLVSSGMIVCGTVNAKNGFGGYIGKQNWLAVAKWDNDSAVHAEAMVAGTSAQFWPAWRKACRDNKNGIGETERILAKSFEQDDALQNGRGKGAGTSVDQHDPWSVCSQHWLASTDRAAWDAANLELRGHVIDCTTLYKGSLPRDSEVVAEGKKYNATEEADQRASEDFLTCKLGRKPDDRDYWNELRRVMANNELHKPQAHAWMGIEHYSASYVAYLHRCARRVSRR